FRDRLPRGTALRRLARTYVVGMVHPADSGQCYHARQVTTPCLNAPEEVARDHAALIAAALVQTQRRTRCGATAATVRIHRVERAVDWHP
ncbi:hypothetical protein, partial [Allosalinactinospora lopnorensis]|uniref:hypothetical protein n=1 Tax=Allosalinactinospora lopnorensis TaxID=1352348 RepID=UPI000623DB5C